MGGEDDSTTSPSGSSMKIATLKVGDKWVIDVTDPEIKGGSGSMEIVKDNSTYNSVDVYEAATSITAPAFTSEGIQFKNLVMTGKLYKRKSDQVTVYSQMTMNADVIFPGETVTQKLKTVEESSSKITGAMPATLTAGLSWTIKDEESTKSTTYVDGDIVDK